MEARPDASVGEHWVALARLWALSGPPLRVSPDDLASYSAAFGSLLAQRPRPRVVLLGVTPELYRLPWPRGTDLIAVDRSRSMIDHVWVGPPDQVRCEDWAQLSLSDASRDLALCDGGLHLMAYPSGQSAFVTSLARVISVGGLCVMRLFVPPSSREPAANVIADMSAGRIPNVNVLKLRLAMAIQTDPRDGVAVNDVWTTFHDAEPDTAAFAARTGWDPKTLATLEAYRDSASRYHFVTLEEATGLFCSDPGGFELVSTLTPEYEIGERCPVVSFRRAD